MLNSAVSLRAIAILQLIVAGASAQLMVEPPGQEGNGNPISSRDRIYTGDQSSNTITVIDPSQNRVLGTIALGGSRLGSDLGPQYVESVNAHGMGFSRDGRYLVSLSVLSNSVNVFRTLDNTLVSETYVDRGPHEAFFGPDNRTVWIGTRGVSTVEVIDGLNSSFIGRIFTAAGPSKVLFNGNGSTAYVNHIFDNIISVIDVPTMKVEYNITGLAAKFSSDMMIAADSQRLWAAHKMTGQVSVIDLAARKVIAVLDTGVETNHPNFAVLNGTVHGFVTVAAENATKVYRQADPANTPELVKVIPMTGIQPHPLWPSADNTRMYVANQHSDTMDVIDLNSLEVIDTIRIGQDSQSLVYISNAVPEGQNETENLWTQGLGLRVENRLISVFDGAGNNTRQATPNPYGFSPHALITIRETDGLDMFQVIGRNLIANGTYTASARCLACGEDLNLPLVTFKASQPSRNAQGMMDGCGDNEEVLAFIKFFDSFDIDSVHVSHGVM